MERRTFLAMVPGGLLAAPLAAEAQQAARIPRVGVLFASTPRYGQAGGVRMSDLASQLVRAKVDVIVAATDPATAAARQQTRTIPIVMANCTHPVGAGFVASLARPGGNVTGLSAQSPELGGKRLELLREVVPGLTRAAIMWNPDVRGALFDYKETETAARSMGLKLQSAEVTRGEDIDGALSDVTSQRAQALVVQTPNPIIFANRTRLTSLVLKGRLPSMYGQREYVEAGGLIAYGPNTVDLWRRAARYVDRILKGARPGDLPVEQSTRFELVINLKTAKALGLTIPPSLLARADQVIE